MNWEKGWDGLTLKETSLMSTMTQSEAYHDCTHGLSTQVDLPAPPSWSDGIHKVWPAVVGDELEYLEGARCCREDAALGRLWIIASLFRPVGGGPVWSWQMSYRQNRARLIWKGSNIVLCWEIKDECQVRAGRVDGAERNTWSAETWGPVRGRPRLIRTRVEPLKPTRRPPPQPLKGTKSLMGHLRKYALSERTLIPSSFQ